MAKQVQFNIKLNIDGKEQIVTASTNVKQLANELGIAQTKTARLRDSLLVFNQVGQAFNTLTSGLQQLTGVMQQYTAAYSAQNQAENKLMTVMQNTMGARAEEVQGVKDLCAAQQQVGVVGDEVQLAGAQELAMHLKTADALRTLIPLMNDLAVQQDGVKVSSSTATSVAALLGKAMDGNTGALKRAGIVLTETQEKMLKTGDEMQRAAVLAEAVGQRVGGMNQELAKTDAGKAQQLSNSIGDLKEQIGGMFASIEPVIVAVAELGLAISALSTVGTSLAALRKAFLALTAVTKASTVATVAQTIATKAASVATAAWTAVQTFANRMQIAWTFGARAFVIQTVAMKAALAGVIGLGVAAAIYGMVAALKALTGQTEHAAAVERGHKDALETVKAAEEEAMSTSAKARAEMDNEIKKLGALIKAKGDTRAAVQQLNEKYGEWFGYCNNAQQWYDTLISKSEAYCRQLGYEAQMRVYQEKMASLEIEKERNRREQEELRKNGTDVGVVSVGGGQFGTTQTVATESSQMKKLRLQAEQTQTAMDDLNKSITATKSLMQQNSANLATPAPPTTPAATTRTTTRTTPTTTTTGTDTETKLIEQARTYADLANNVQYYQQQLEKADVTDWQAIQTLVQKKKAAEDAVTAFEAMSEAMGLPINLDTLDAYDRKIQWLRGQRNSATADSLAAIDKEIARLEQERQAFEDASLAAMRDDELRTYDELSRKQDYYNRLLQQGDEKQRAFAQAGVRHLNDIREAWEAADRAATISVNPSDLNSLKAVSEAIGLLQERQKGESGSQVESTQREIERLEQKQAAIQLRVDMPSMEKELADLRALDGAEYRIKVREIGFDGIISKMRELEKLMQNPDLADDQLEQLQRIRSGYEAMLKDTGKKTDAMMEALGQAGQAFSSLGQSIEVPELNVAGTMAQAIATMVLSYADALKMSSALGPIGWIGFGAAGLAQLAAIVSSVKGMAKFAQGGIVSGPTMALVGEYAGAANNPEVIAPLDKLRSMIQPSGVGGTVRFEIDGRKLVGVISNETRISSKSGRRTNITG